MKPLDRDRNIVEHILGYCVKISRTVERFGSDMQIFLEDSDYRDSISMNLLQIGELAGKLSDKYVQDTKAEIDWRAIKNMRNMFAHDYGSMDIERIWETAIEDIPVLTQYCEKCLSEE